MTLFKRSNDVEVSVSPEFDKEYEPGETLGASRSGADRLCGIPRTFEGDHTLRRAAPTWRAAARPVQRHSVRANRNAHRRGVDFTAMTTLAVLVRGHIILAAGKVWRYVIGTSATLPDGVRGTAPRDATDADFRNQLRILRAGISQLRSPTGPNLDYIVRLPAEYGRA